jgi:acyl-CoA thioester hydrolase
MTATLDGTTRNGRHHMQVRVYYEDTDFSGLLRSGW